MNNLLVVAVAAAFTAFLAAAGLIISNWWRDKRRAQREDTVAKAAQSYLARFDVHAQIVAITLADLRIALMVETPPHKKLRFSHIIEQPIKQFVFSQTQIEIDRLFWRFPIPDKNTLTPEVQYGATTTPVIPITPSAHTETATPAAKSAQEEDDDDYFKRQAYKIEEVSWEDFSALSQTTPVKDDPKQ